MLKDELQAVRELIWARRPAISDFELNKHYDEILHAWCTARFSDATEQSFARYLNYHLSAVAGLSNELARKVDHQPCDQLKTLLLHLARHLLDNYGFYLNGDSVLPAALFERPRVRLVDQIRNLQKPLPGYVGQWLMNFISSGCPIRSQLRNYRYLELLSEAIHAQNFETEEDLVSFLISINFNHLALYEVITSLYAGQSQDIVRRKRFAVMAVPARAGVAFDPEWMSLKDMLAGWLVEEIRLTDEKPKAGISATEKLYLDVSVAHLAFFTRLFYEESLMGTASLTEIFRQVCASMRTKRQPAISEGSFSKEFYGTDQHTAARVRDILQRMLARINRKFFP